MQSTLFENSEVNNAKKTKSVERRRKQKFVKRDASIPVYSNSGMDIFRKEDSGKLNKQNKIIYQRSWMRASKSKRRKTMTTMTYSKFRTTIPKILKKSQFSKFSHRFRTPSPPLPPPRFSYEENSNYIKNFDGKSSNLISKKNKHSNKKKKYKRKLSSKTNEVHLECYFCRKHLPDRIYGPHEINNLKIYVHEHCLIWSTGIYLKENGELYGLKEAANRRKKCSKCNKPIATVCCSVKRCSANFHWPCIKDSNDYDINNDTFLIKCKKHLS